MSSKKIGLGLIGVGGHGRRHAESFSAMEKEGLVHVTGLADPSVGALDLGKQLFADAKCYSDYLDLLGDPNLDAVVVSSPVPYHEEMIHEAIKRKIFVLIEKPAVPLVSQLKNLLAHEGADRVAVGFQWLATHSMNLLKELICEGKLGRLKSLQVFAVWPRSSIYYDRTFWSGKMFWHGHPVLDGPATNALSHWINNIMFLAGDSRAEFGVPEKVCGETYRANRSLKGYDTAFLAGRFPRGTEFRAAFSHASSQTVFAELRAEGDRGQVILSESGALSSEDICIPDHEIKVGDEALRRNFLDFAAGKTSKPTVTLRDVMGYTLATNLMFQSSGGIHQVPTESCRQVSGPTGETFMHIEQGVELLQGALSHGQGLRAAGAEWAIPLEALNVEDFDEATMIGMLTE